MTLASVGGKQLWADLITKAPVHHLAGVFLAMAGLGALLVWSRLWHGGVRQVVVWCHEWGHVVAAMLCGGEVRGMRLNHETSGVTNFTLRQGQGEGTRTAFVAFCGEPAPGIVGLILVAMVSYGYAYAGLVVLSAFVVATVLLIRNWWGLLVVVVGAGVLAACSWLISPAQAAWPVLGVAAVLVWGGLRDIAVAINNRRLGGGEGSDGAKVAGFLHISQQPVEGLWLVLWAGCTGGAVAVVVLV